MKFLKSAILGVASALVMASSAHAVPFTVASTSFTVGGGYGSQANNNNRLDVTFATTGGPFGANLLAAGDSFNFLFGMVTLNETCIDFATACGSSGNQDETDDLSVIANFIFTNPVSNTVQTLSVVGAVVGNVNDGAVDFTIDFSPTVMNFGNGGSFRIDMSDISFSNVGDQTTTATITLLTVPQAAPAEGTVPEPASLALLGLGLLGVGAARRRK